MPSATEENAALVRRFLTDVIAGGDIDAVDGFLATDVADYNPVFGGTQGSQTVSALGWQVLAAADVNVNVANVVATDDWVAVRGQLTGTHRESLMDLAPTGRSFEIAYAWFCRIENGKIDKIWWLPDGLSLMQQLGEIPRES